MPEFVNYQLQRLPIRQIDTNLVGNALATITAGNKEALQKQSELRTAINTLDMNEAEDGFRQKVYDEITKTIEDNSIEGNAYYALDDLLKKYGNIYEIPGVVGRLKAQQAYKKYQETLDARVLKGDISQDTADWAKDKNPYQYQDKYKLDADGNQVLDANGNPIIVGGTEWKPTITPVNDIDFNEVFNEITKYLKPESDQWSGVNAFIYKDGSTGNKFIPGETLDYLSESTGGYVKLTPKKIREAIQNAFQNNPQLAAQAHQAWKVLEWKADNGLISPKNNGEVYSENGVYNAQGGFFDKDGQRKSYEDYIMDIVDGYARTHQYNTTTSTVKYNSNGIRDSYDRVHGIGKYAEKDNKDGGISRETGNTSYDGVYGGRYITTMSNFSSNLGEYEALQSEVLSSLANIGIKLDKMPNSPEEFLNLRNNITSEEALKVFDSTYKNYKDHYDIFRGEFEYIKDFRSDERAAWEGANDVLQTLGSGRSLNEIADSKNITTQEFIKEWTNIVDKTFGSYDIISYEAKSKQAIDKIISELGGLDAAIDYGFVVSGNTISIDKNHSYLLYNLSSAIGGIPGKYVRKNNFDDNGNRLMYGSLAEEDKILFMTTNQVNNKINSFNRKVQNLSDLLITENKNDDDSQIEVPFYITDGANPAEIELRSIKELVGDAEYERMYKEAVERFENVKNHDFTNITIRQRTGVSGNAIPVDDATKKDIIEAFKFSNKNQDMYQPYVARVEGIGLLPGCRFSVSEGSGNNKTVKYYDIVIDDYTADSDMIRYNRMNPIVRNESSTIYNWNKDIPIYLGRSIYGEIYVNPIKENPKYQWVGSINGTQSNFVGTNNEIAALRNAYIELVTQRDSVVNTVLAQESEEAKAKFLSEYVNDFIDKNPKIKGLFNNYSDIYSYVMLNLRR